MIQFLVLISFISVACVTTKEYHLENAREVPAAEGVVKLKPDKGGNNFFELAVKHLAKPATVLPGSSTFVVWVQAALGDPKPQNIGVLSVDQELKGKLKTTLPYNSFNVFVTPEPSGFVTYPSGPKILLGKETLKFKKTAF